jgi:DNA-directed RNA polymerase specialized sigma24 family protein
MFLAYARGKILRGSSSIYGKDVEDIVQDAILRLIVVIESGRVPSDIDERYTVQSIINNCRDVVSDVIRKKHVQDKHKDTLKLEYISSIKDPLEMIREVEERDFRASLDEASMVVLKEIEMAEVNPKNGKLDWRTGVAKAMGVSSGSLNKLEFRERKFKNIVIKMSENGYEFK